MDDKKIRESEDKVNRNGLGMESNHYIPQEENSEYIASPEFKHESKSTSESDSKFTTRIKTGAKILMGVFVVAFIAAIAFNGTTSGSQVEKAVAQKALDMGYSTAIAAGSQLLTADENMIGQDYTITHNSDEDETTLWIWDYAAEDGDYVQVLLDGEALGEPFMIKHKAVSYKVPTTAEVQIVGTHDGGGGITYGVYYEVNQTTYLNGMDEGSGNIYTLVHE